MPTSAFEAAPDVTAPAVAIDMAAGPPPNRPIAWAIAFSAFLHLLLLVTIGLASFEASAPSSAPEVRLSIELADGRDTEHDMAGPVERPAAPITKSSEGVLATANQPRTSKLASLARKPTPSPLPTQDDATNNSSPLTSSTDGDASPEAKSSTATAAAATQPGAAPLTESVHSDSAVNDAAVLTTPGVGDSEQSARAVTSGQPQESGAGGGEESVRVEAPVHQEASEIATREQSVLARWVVQAAQGLQDANLTQGRLSLQHEGRQYAAFLERRPAADEMDIERVNVAITTEKNGKRLRTLLQLKRLAFSHFTQLVDEWDTEVQLHDDEIEGRFHSNSEITLGYDAKAPKFLGKVTTAALHYKIATAQVHMRPIDIFRGGIETRVAPIALPRSPGFASNPGGENTKVRSFTRGTRVTFYPDGSYGWREIGSDAPENKQVPINNPHYIVGSRGTILCVRGTVRGKVVVYSPERIVIESSLLYAHDPRSSRDADDYLGLISSKDIEIAPQKVTGPGDLEIHAALYAKRRFIVTDEGARGTATLWIHGSLTAGSLSATEPRYATRYDFDRRFEQVRPPGFPVTDRYELEAWDGQWREAGDDPSGGAAEPGAASRASAPRQ